MPSAGGGGGTKILDLELGDDVTAVAKGMAKAVRDLAEETTQLEGAFKKLASSALGPSLEEARSLFKSLDHDVEHLKASLIAMKSDKVSIKEIVKQLTKELGAERKQQLGITAAVEAERAARKKVADDKRAEIALAKKNIRDQIAGEKKAESERNKAHKLWMQQQKAQVRAQARADRQLAAAQTRYARDSTLRKRMHRAAWAVRDMRTFARPFDYMLEKLTDGIQAAIEPVLNAVKFRENSNNGLTAMFNGDSESARKLTDYSVRVEQQSGIDKNRVTPWLMQLHTAGFAHSELAPMIGMIADQERKKEGWGDSAASVFSRLRGRQASQRDMYGLQSAGFYNASAIYADLNAKYKLGGKSPGDVEKRVKKYIAGGNVSGSALINSVIRTHVPPGQLPGDFALAQGKNLPHALERAKGSLENLISSTDVENWGGIKALEGFLERFIAVMSDKDGAGGRLLKNIEKAVNNLLEGFNKLSSEDISQFLDEVGEDVGKISEYAKTAWEYVDKLLHGDGSILSTLDDALGAGMEELGEKIASGFWTTVKALMTGGDTPGTTRQLKSYGMDDKTIAELASDAKLPFDEVKRNQRKINENYRLANPGWEPYESSAMRDIGNVQFLRRLRENGDYSRFSDAHWKAPQTNSETVAGSGTMQSPAANPAAGKALMLQVDVHVADDNIRSKMQSELPPVLHREIGAMYRRMASE